MVIMSTKKKQITDLALQFFSPILAITQYGPEEYVDGSIVFACFTLVEDLLPCMFFIGSVVVFFIFPLAILICIYALIAKSLMAHPTVLITTRTNIIPSQSVVKYRKQVIVMLGTVVVAFFICLLPFRALTLWIIIAPAGSSFQQIGFENYYNILYFSRIMFHINSAVNPILYNAMSSKFRGGFFKLCGLKSIKKRYRRRTEITRKSTTSSSAHTTSQQTSDTNLKGSRSHSRYSSSLREVKEVASEGESSASPKQGGNISKNVYIRAPLQIVNGICGQKLPSGEIFV